MQQTDYPKQIILASMDCMLPEVLTFSILAGHTRDLTSSPATGLFHPIRKDIIAFCYFLLCIAVYIGHGNPGKTWYFLFIKSFLGKLVKCLLFFYLEMENDILKAR